jgi:N-acetylmuramoyl-L-alanine amidase
MPSPLNQAKRDRRALLITAVTTALFKPVISLAQGRFGVPLLRIETKEKSAVVSLEQLSASHTISSFSISDPPRFVIDIEGLVLTPEIANRLRISVNDNPFINRVAVSQFNPNTTRVVINLRERLFARAQQTSGRESASHGLTVELRLPKDAKQAESKPALSASQTSETSKSQVTEEPQPATGRNQVLVLIDPGHGGDDLGVVGALGTREKDVTLAVAKTLAEKLGKAPRVAVELTRDNDVSISIPQRLEKIKRLKPAVVISLHSARYPLPTSTGPRVFYYANTATSPSAELIAQRENGSIGATPDRESGKSKLGPPIVATKIQAALTRQQSIIGGAEGAPFSVLSLSINNGVLIQLGNLENRTEEARLRSGTYQEDLAELLYQGLISVAEPVKG